MGDGDVSHDRVTRLLPEREYTSKDLWTQVKETVRTIEKNGGVLIFDDTIQEKEWTDENEVMCWHKIIALGVLCEALTHLNALYHSGEMSIPVAFEVVKKPLHNATSRRGK